MEAEDSTCDPDLAKNARQLSLSLETCSTPPFSCLCSKTHACPAAHFGAMGSAFPSGQAGSPRRLLQTFIPTRFQFLGDWNYQS